MAARPPSPPIQKGLFSSPFEKFARDEGVDQWASAFTLLDTVETYFDSHVDLLQRKLQKHSDRLKMKAEEKFKIKDLSGDLLSSETLDREMKNMKLKFAARITNLLSTWQSAQVVRTREKVSFFFGVMNLLASALMFGLAPQWVHISYTIQGLYLLPLRYYQYKKRAWHYFLFDLCYYVTILNFVYFWIFPSSKGLWIACYLMSHGSLASAVITWRNSLVFHDQDKVTSLFIHIYAPFAFTVIRHFYPGAEERFPGMAATESIAPIKGLFLSSGIYVIWQFLYWKFLWVDRRAKIQSGQRTTSFSWLLNDKRSAIGKALAAFPEQYRVEGFMFGQLLYAILTELPAIFLLYGSARWSAAFLLLIFSVSVWNGGGFYIEVFGRKFEKEVEALRKELAEATARSGPSTPGLSAASSPQVITGELPIEIELPVPDSDVSSLASSTTSNGELDLESKKDA